MSRVIKYRAWHKTEQKMYPVVGTLKNIVMLSPSEDSMMTADIDEVELLQFTGLLDTHGKEIWDGDIVRINHPLDLTGDFTNAVGVVFWDEEGALFCHSNNNGRPPKRMWKYVEVIGNFYEHPHLLKQEEGA